MDDLSTRIKHSLRCLFLFSFLLCTPGISIASPQLNEHTYIQLADNGDSTTETVINEDESNDDTEEDDVIGYLEGCTGGAAVGSIVPGIGTLIGGIVGCGMAWFW